MEVLDLNSLHYKKGKGNRDKGRMRRNLRKRFVVCNLYRCRPHSRLGGVITQFYLITTVAMRHSVYVYFAEFLKISPLILSAAGPPSRSRPP